MDAEDGKRLGGMRRAACGVRRKGKHVRNVGRVGKMALKGP